MQDKWKVSVAIAENIFDGLNSWQQGGFYSPCIEMYGQWDEKAGYYNTSAGGYFSGLGGNPDPLLSVDFRDIDLPSSGGTVSRVGVDVTQGGTYSVPGVGFTYNTVHLTVNSGPLTLWSRFSQETLGNGKWIADVYAVNDSMAQALPGATAVLHELAHVVHFIQAWNPGTTFSLLGPGLGADGGKRSEAYQTRVFDSCTAVWMTDHLPKR